MGEVYPPLAAPKATRGKGGGVSPSPSSPPTRRGGSICRTASRVVLPEDDFPRGGHSKGDAPPGQPENGWAGLKKVFRNGLQLVIESKKSDHYPLLTGRASFFLTQNGKSDYFVRFDLEEQAFLSCLRVYRRSLAKPSRS